MRASAGSEGWVVPGRAHAVPLALHAVLAAECAALLAEFFETKRR